MASLAAASPRQHNFGGSSSSPASSSLPASLARRGTIGSSATTVREQEDAEDGDGEDEEEDEDHMYEAEEAREMLNEVTVKSGYLLKKGEKRKTWKKRWFVLRSSKLCYYKNEKEYQLLRYIDMSEVHSISAIELKGKENTFGIVTPRRAYYVKASSFPEMQQWINALNEVKTQMSQRNTLAHGMDELSMTTTTSPGAAAGPSSSSAHAPSQAAVAKAASSAAAQTANAPAVSINIPGKGRYAGPPQPRSTGGGSGGDAFSPLTATTDSDTGAEQYGLSYTSSTGGQSLGSSPSRDGAAAANRSGSEVSDQGGRGSHVRRASQRRDASGSGGGRRDASIGSQQEGGVPASYNTAGVLSSSDEEEEEDEQLDQAMPLPSLGGAAPQQHAQQQPQQQQQQQQQQQVAQSQQPQAVTQPPQQSELLRDPNRIITQGYLMKQSNRRKHWRKRWFVLTASRLMYTRSHMDAKAHRQVPIGSILDAIEYGGAAGGGAAGGGGKRDKGVAQGAGSPTSVSSPLGGTFSLGEGGQQGADGEGSAIPSGSALAHEDDPSPAPAPPARRQSVVAAAAGMASNVSAGMGMGTGGSSNKRMDNCFKIITPKRVFLLCAPTEEEEIKWLSALQALLARSRGSSTAAATGGGTAGGLSSGVGAGAGTSGEGAGPTASGLVGSPSVSAAEHS